MSQALANSNDSKALRAPDERVIQMIATCARQLERVATIEDAISVTDAAQAVSAIARKIEVAKEVKRAATRLLVDAEARLGAVLRAIPPKRRGDGGSMPKKAIIESHGINKHRASVAQRLAVTPDVDIDRAIDDGATTIHAVSSKLGFETHSYELRMQKANAMASIADEAVGLLERCVHRQQVPHAGTVANLSTWLQNVKGHGNRRPA